MTLYKYWLPICLALLVMVCATPHRPVVAQTQTDSATEVESDDEQVDNEEEFEGEEFEEDEGEEFEEEEDEEFEEFEDEEFEEEEEGVEFLMEFRADLRRELEHLAESRTAILQRIESIDRLIKLTQQVPELEDAIVEAEEDENEDRVASLERQLERLETELNIWREIIELEGEMVGIEEDISDAEREEDDERLELLELLRDGFREIRDINQELLPVYLAGNEEAEARLEARKADIFTRKIEKPFRAIDTLEQLREAEEEEDDSLIEELQGKLETLIRDATGRSEPDNEKQVAKPRILPVVINPQTLAQYENVNLQEEVEPLLRQYCFDCHSNDSSSGELNLEKLLAVSPIVTKRDQWINVIEQSRNHVMPPEDGDQPTTAEREKIVLSLHNAIHNFDYSRIDDPGFETARRLTHREYSNTVRDLFGIDIDVVDRFPTDLTATSGFDNSANSLFIQPLLLERYLGIAEHVVTTALPDTPRTAEEHAAHERIFGGISGRDSVAARNLLERFLTRAYRRPPRPLELDRFTRQIETAIRNGADFETAVKATLQAVLITPSFLLLTESEPEQDIANSDQPYAITDWELASRLSYFLWASMPDDELLEHAKTGQLREPAVLKAQVSRMLADPKSDTLGSVFTAQWLGSQHLGTRVRMDPIDNPWCTDSLMAAMRDETAMFFNSIVRENRPVTSLIESDYTFMNEELANHYRIEGVQGDAMRRVSVDPQRRGGIFGQGALLAVTAFPGRTSPVVRGKWILDNVLGTPPPPPPPNVSELSEEVAENRRLSFRQKLELHREKPNCYACHSQMDPLGFSLEQFDWFGRYRSRQGRRRIDAKGELPNGTEFVGLAGLKQVIVEQRDEDLLRQVSQKMLSYALGRQLEYYDEPAIRKIVRLAKTDQMRMQTIITEIVNSYPFRFKKKRPAATLSAATQTLNATQTAQNQ